MDQQRILGIQKLSHVLLKGSQLFCSVSKRNQLFGTREWVRWPKSWQSKFRLVVFAVVSFLIITIFCSSTEYSRSPVYSIFGLAKSLHCCWSLTDATIPLRLSSRNGRIKLWFMNFSAFRMVELIWALSPISDQSCPSVVLRNSRVPS